MIFNMKKKNKKFIFFIFVIISFGIFIRFYNLNYNDMWSDEMVTFWLSDPSINLNETLNRIFISHFMVLYEIILKYFHKIFGYDVYVSRYLSLATSALSLIYFYLLTSKISNNNSVIFAVFLLSINIYHIAYSSELRSYILTFLLVLIFIYYNFENEYLKKKINIMFILKINLILILMLFCHPFTLLVSGSFVVYKFLDMMINNKRNKNEFLFLTSVIVSTSIFLLIYFQTTIKFHDPAVLKGEMYIDWLTQVKPSFYTNFYFSKFFGSRLLGSIYLLAFIICCVKFRKSLFQKFNIFSFFIILIIFSYSIPLLFGYIFYPIILDRYIFFVLIPILCLISHFIFQIKPKLFSYSLAILVCLMTFFNHLFFENTLRQFYTGIYPNKPEIKKVLKHINLSDNSNFTFKTDDRFEINTNEIYENYYQKYLEKLKLKLNYISFKKQNDFPDTLWVIYLKDTTNIDYNISEKFNGYKVVDKKYFNRVELYLLSNKI